MFKSYLTTAFRHLMRERIYSLINIAGLAVGFACFILILLFVRDELSYDRFFADSDRIYRLVMTLNIPGRDPMRGASVMPPAADFLKADFGEIEQVARLSRQRAVIGRGEYLNSEYLFHADPGLFEIFDLPFVTGDAESALSEPNTVVLTQSAARKYFGDDDPFGQTLIIDNEHTFRVTGVLADLPSATHLTFEILTSFESASNKLDADARDDWFSGGAYTYVLLASGSKSAPTHDHLEAFLDRHAPRIQGMPFTAVDLYDLEFEPITDIHLESGRQLELKPGGDARVVYAFSVIASLVLAMAIINFVNLTTARATQRAREVALRKVVGATRRQLVIQFLGEAAVLTLLALVMAVALGELLLPWYNSLLGRSLSLNVAGDPAVILGLGLIAALAALGGGAYPSFYLARLRTGDFIRGAYGGTSQGQKWFRSLLVVAQFSISIGLMTATAVVYLQSEYGGNIYPGFDSSGLIVLQGNESDDAGLSTDVLRNELLRDPRVLGVTTSTTVPGDPNEGITAVRIAGAPEAELLTATHIVVGHQFFETYRIPVLAGRPFGPDFGASESSEATGAAPNMEAPVVLNKSAVRRFGLGAPADAIGKVIDMPVSDEASIKLTVVGVVGDVHLKSLRHQITPVMFTHGLGGQRFVTVRIAESDIVGALAGIDQVWKALRPGVPVRQEFLDARLRSLYEGDRGLATALAVFSVLGTVISSLGLLGLATFSAARRTREIGLRKILGATVPKIVRLLLWDFGRPVLLANLVAIPVVFVIMRNWLDGFAYRIDLSPTIFLGAGALTLLIAWVTVAWQAARSAATRPAAALRHQG